MEQLLEIGPQYEKDDSFTARMRFHQSWYRANMLRVPYGTGPKPNSTRLLGSMLMREYGQNGYNFITPEIFKQAVLRLQEPGAVEPFRLQHNMLSSQPMCFNLFIPLAMDLNLATNVFTQIIPEIEQVTSVKLEFAPEPAKDYIADRTAFDAFVEFTAKTGTLGFIGIETKLTEPFSQKIYDGQAYRRWLLPDSPWPEQSWLVLSKIDYNQLWRGHLLAYSMTKQLNNRYGRGYSMLLRHPLDTQCQSAGEAYKRLLKPSDESFISFDLECFLRFIEGAITNAEAEQWCRNFRDRYLNLALSDHEWQNRVLPG